MCGRYAATANPDDLVEEFDISFVDDAMTEFCAPRYNIAPTDQVPVILERMQDAVVTRSLRALRWGLVPSWAKQPGAALINARVETVAEKPAFRKPIKSRRCLVPAIGYYEWRSESQAVGVKPIKQPYFLSTGSSLAMAGIYEFWRSPTGWISSVSIITTAAEDEFGWLHDRMPMVVGREHIADWLDPLAEDASAALALLRTPSGLQHRRVSRLVNRVGNDGPELISEIGE